jgi:hypothetical protein
MEENSDPKKVLYKNLEKRLKGRPRKIVGRKGWKERVYNREEWKKLLKMARNHHILHMPME